MSPATLPRISAVHPLWAVEGGVVTIEGTGFSLDPELPEVRIGGVPARLSLASERSLTAVVPRGLDGFLPHIWLLGPRHEPAP